MSRLLAKNRAAAHAYLLLVIFFGWILFKFENLSDVLCVLKGMFGAGGNKFSDFETVTTIKSYIVILAVSVIASTPIARNISVNLKHISLKSNGALAVYSVLQILVPVVLLLLSVAALVGNSYNPFLYFRF